MPGRRLALVGLLLGAFSASAGHVLRLHGSNTVGERLAPALVAAFAREQGYTVGRTEQRALDEWEIHLQRDGKDSSIEIVAHGTGTGLEALQHGGADLWMASRPVTAEELTRALPLGRLDHPRQEHVIALDGLAVVSHPQRPQLTLSLDQLQAIFSGRIRQWSELGEKGGAIHLHARDAQSGTYDTFRNLVLRGQSLAESATRHESSDALVQAVRSDPDALGFVGLAASGAARRLAVAERGSRGLLPSRMSVATEDYPLARRLYLYHGDQPTPLVTQFVEFAQGEAGQRIAEEIGFVGQQLIAASESGRGDMPTEYLALTEGAERVSVNFRFDSGLTYLDGKAQRDLDRLAAFLGDPAQTGGELTLIGFSDATESAPIAALMLSNERADYIADQLTQRSLRVRLVRGMGALAPVASNDDEAGRARNRRVEVWLRRRHAPPASVDSAARTGR